MNTFSTQLIMVICILKCFFFINTYMVGKNDTILYFFIFKDIKEFWQSLLIKISFLVWISVKTLRLVFLVPSSTPRCSSYWKGSLGVTLFTLLYLLLTTYKLYEYSCTMTKFWSGPFTLTYLAWLNLYGACIIHE